ncbi:hypothetical protein [Streptomyces canus]
MTTAVVAILLGGLGTGTAHADTNTALYVDNLVANCSGRSALANAQCG